MARAITRRDQSALGAFTNSMTEPGRVVVPALYFSPPKGLNTYATRSRVSPEYCTEITNMTLDQQTLLSRRGLTEIGDASSEAVMAVLAFNAPDATGRLLRIRLSGLDVWNGASWVAISGITFTGGLLDRFTWTGWANELLICNGIDKIMSYNAISGVGRVIEESMPAKHLTSFGNRVIASAVTEGNFYGYRQRWSVKLDSDDWTSETTSDGIGAGFEDFKGTPGGWVDQLIGTYPLSDDTALVVRENSLWLQFLTGNVDAPHRYTRLTSEIGSRARFAAAVTPFGVVVLSQDDVVVVGQSSVESIGTLVRRSLHASITNYNEVTGVYDPRRREYRLSTNNTVWRYSFDDKGWTKDTYSSTIQHMSFVDYRSLGLIIGDLVGTIGDLAGRIGDLVIEDENEAVNMVLNGTNQTVTEDDVSDDMGTAASIELRTGLLQAESHLNKTELIEAQLEYEATEEQQVVFEYSYDGVVWFNYSSATIVPTETPDILRVRRTLISHNLQIRLASSTLGILRVISLNLFVVKGPRVRP